MTKSPGGHRPYRYQQRGYYSMPDMLSVGQGKQTHAQYRAQMLLWSVMGTWPSGSFHRSVLSRIFPSFSHVHVPERPHGGRGFLSTPPNLTISPIKIKILFGAGASGGPLILGNDIRQMDPFIKALVTAPEVLAVNSDSDVVQGSFLRGNGSYEIWGKPIGRRVVRTRP